jgi:hypothetical protein
MLQKFTNIYQGLGQLPKGIRLEVVLQIIGELKTLERSVYEKDPCHFDGWFICLRRLRNHTGQHSHTKLDCGDAHQKSHQKTRAQESEGFPQSDEVREGCTRCPLTIDRGTGFKAKQVPVQPGLALLSLWQKPGNAFIGVV